MGLLVLALIGGIVGMSYYGDTEAAAQPTNLNLEHGNVKKSSSSICHAPQSPHYTRVKKFDLYDSLEDCLSSGGSLPAGR